MKKSFFFPATLFLVMTFVFMIPQQAIAQRAYNRSVGLRLGYPTAISYKTFLGVNGSNAIEAYMGTRGYSYYGRNISLSLAYLHHEDLSPFLESLKIPRVENLAYFYGAGISGYIWTYDSNYNRNRYSSYSWGFQLYGGLEYTFEDLPLVVSADWSPGFVLGRAYYYGLGLGYRTLSIRYILD